MCAVAPGSLTAESDTAARRSRAHCEPPPKIEMRRVRPCARASATQRGGKRPPRKRAATVGKRTAAEGLSRGKGRERMHRAEQAQKQCRAARVRVQDVKAVFGLKV